MNILITLLLFLLPVLFLLSWRRRGSSRKLPPGSLGIPIIGQSFGLLRALRTNTVDEWLHERVRKYGPISKLTLFGKPTVFIHGQAANKLVFCGDSSKIASKQTSSTRAILGDCNLMELTGQDHKRVRDSIVSFLRPESLKQYVGKMDEEVRKHIELHWQGKEKVAVLPLMKNLTFNIICSLLFGMEERAEREKFLQSFEEMMKGMLSIPVKLPFTRYNRSLRASSRVQALLKEVVQEKKVKLEQHTATPHQDLITCLLSKRNEENERVMTDKEILHNITTVMVAGYDTSSVLITFVLRLLSKNPAVYKAVLQEQEEIAKSKTSGEPLTWEDLARMKYTWRVAMETLRMVPPVFGGFRVALKDIDYGGYIIPKGWQIFWASNMTHMDESIFPEPSKFDPARFENQKSVPSYSFVAFGGGPRVCPGNEFARIETLAAIHYLVTQYSWELCSNDHYIFDPMPVPTQGLLLRIVAKIQK
ncbi:cytochrome P450 716B1-like [Syzygium oleosum]|uniref:cytochrome P450 716B1-like n=1 Tax=Syzygium oleosum TaxID=219896 RepID=UPI0011D2A71C|nr:cytochrome P450 716B1-like [Syzygium oleosum]